METILFDIDLTLLDTDKIREKRIGELVRFCRRDKVTVVNEVGRYISSLETSKDFNPRELSKYLSMRWGFGVEQLMEKSWNVRVAGGVLYKETVSVLTKLRKRYRLGLYSEGFPEFQRDKLRFNGIDKFFEEKITYLTRRKRDEALVIGMGEVIIVDDNPEIIKYLRVFQNVRPIWLNRKSKKKMPGVKTIFNLNQLMK